MQRYCSFRLGRVADLDAKQKPMVETQTIRSCSQRDPDTRADRMRQLCLAAGWTEACKGRNGREDLEVRLELLLQQADLECTRARCRSRGRPKGSSLLDEGAVEGSACQLGRIADPAALGGRCPVVAETRRIQSRAARIAGLTGSRRKAASGRSCSSRVGLPACAAALRCCAHCMHAAALVCRAEQRKQTQKDSSKQQQAHTLGEQRDWDAARRRSSKAGVHSIAASTKQLLCIHCISKLLCMP